MNRNKNIFTAISVASVLGVSGCSSNISKFSSVKAVPVETTTSLSSALDCTSNILDKHSQKNVYVFLVRSIVDGTVRAVSRSDGPLADSGRLQLKSKLHKLIPSSNAIIIDNYPLIFMSSTKGTIGLDRFGLPKKSDAKSYKKSYLSFINKIREGRGIKPASTIKVITIDGAFTRADESSFNNNGYGADAGNDGTQAKGDIKLGRSKSTKVVSINVNLIESKRNTVIGSQSFDLEYSSITKKYSIKSSAGEGKFGLALSNTDIESIHSAQQTLIDAVSLWVTQKFYRTSNISSCMPKK